MRPMLERLVGFAAALVLLGVAATVEPSALLAGGIAVVVVAVVLGARYAAVGIRSRYLTVGSRSRAHLEVLASLPAPSHPDTAGRTRSRAPSRSFLAA